ncbi:MAG: DUF5034 domain-containing protein [Cytophagaceae bacterium]
MVRIIVLLMLGIGIYLSIQAFSKNRKTSFHSYKITSVKAKHANQERVLYEEDYHMMLKFEHKVDKTKKKPSFKKKDSKALRCSNEITNIQVFSTEKVNEAHPAGKDLSGLFDFHYIRNLESKYGTLIKEGMTVPLSEFENLVDQDNAASQVRLLTLRMRQKPILSSDHQFVVRVLFENGEVKTDTTECIHFEGLPEDYLSKQ